MIFTLTVVGPFVLYRTKHDSFLFLSHRAAYRYLLNTAARKVAGSTRCISGLYLIG